MSRVAYGQKGYSGASMSVNARAAYEAGEMLRSKWTKTAILGALRGYCDEMDLLYDGAFRELGPEETAERDRIRAQAAARVREAERHRREAECLFEYRFSCSPYSAMAYEAFHPELCERRVSKRRKQELVVYRLPDGSEPSGYAEMSVPADYADSSHVVPSVFISGTGGDRAWRDIDFDEAERKFAAAARRAAAFREGRPKLMQDEARRAAIRETRHRVCTAPILKSIKEIHR